MALIDDIELLRRHIRNTFITSDDSGTSEMVRFEMSYLYIKYTVFLRIY